MNDSGYQQLKKDAATLAEKLTEIMKYAEMRMLDLALERDRLSLALHSKTIECDEWRARACLPPDQRPEDLHGVRDLESRIKQLESSLRWEKHEKEIINEAHAALVKSLDEAKRLLREKNEKITTLERDLRAAHERHQEENSRRADMILSLRASLTPESQKMGVCFLEKQSLMSRFEALKSSHLELRYDYDIAMRHLKNRPLWVSCDIRYPRETGWYSVKLNDGSSGLIYYRLGDESKTDDSSLDHNLWNPGHSRCVTDWLQESPGDENNKT